MNASDLIDFGRRANFAVTPTISGRDRLTGSVTGSKIFSELHSGIDLVEFRSLGQHQIDLQERLRRFSTLLASGACGYREEHLAMEVGFTLSATV
jgi:hypothetical protein